MSNTFSQIPSYNNIGEAREALPQGYALDGLHPSYGVRDNTGAYVGVFRSLGGAVRAARQHASGVMVNPAHPRGGRMVYFKAKCRSGGEVKSRTLASVGRSMAACDADVWLLECDGALYDGSDWDQESFKLWSIADAAGQPVDDVRRARIWEAYTASLPAEIEARRK